MLPPAPVSNLMWSEAVPFLLALAGSCIVVYASLNHGAQDIYHYFFGVSVSDGAVVDCIDEQFIVCGCSLSVACSMGSGYSCHIGLDSMESYLMLRAVVLATICGICFATLPRAVVVVPRWASGHHLW